MSSGLGIDQQWARVQNRLRREVGDAAFKSWMQAIDLAGCDDGEVRMTVPTHFIRDWLTRHYSEQIKSCWAEQNPSVKTVDIDVARPRDRSPSPATAKAVTDGANGVNARRKGVAAPAKEALADHPEAESGPEAESRQSGATADVPEEMAGKDPLDGRRTFDNFIVGTPNELAHAAARRVAETSATTFNPLFLYGGVGLGKTHLMHAIAWHIRCHDTSRTVLYTTAERFMHEFVKALRFRTISDFKERFRSVDVLMIDDIQFIGGKENTQVEFFHTLNDLIDSNRQVVVSADKPPADLAGIEERLRSRFTWGLVADVHPTTYELRLGILQAKAEREKVSMPMKVMEFMAQRITSNVREVEGAFNRVAATSEIKRQPITVETARLWLGDILATSARRVSIEEIQKLVAGYYQIPEKEMRSPRRARVVARPRQVAMYLAKLMTSRSLPEIGRMFGGRDHTTVMHSVRKINQLCDEDPAFAEEVRHLKGRLEG
ncbi:MAG: chromosomal replication initiator protein DnaA [Inquilinaceae bacterium]